MDWGQSELPSPLVRDDDRCMKEEEEGGFPGSPVLSTVTPARSLLRNAPASLFRQPVIGTTACKSPPFRGWRTPASSQTTSPTLAPPC